MLSRPFVLSIATRDFMRSELADFKDEMLEELRGDSQPDAD